MCSLNLSRRHLTFCDGQIGIFGKYVFDIDILLC